MELKIKLNKNKKQQEIEVVLLYDNITRIPVEDSIRVVGIGFAHKNDPNIVKDYHDNSRYIMIGDGAIKYGYKSVEIYTDISEDGILLDKHYSIIYKGISLNDNKQVPFSFYENPIFRKYYVEDLETGIFHHRDMKAKPFVKKMKTEGIEFNSIFIDNNKYIYGSFIKTLNKRYTWGVEIETISGYVPQHLSRFSDFSSHHDGSLRDKGDNKAYGKEYVTGILSGDKGLRHLKFLCNELSKRCIINEQCSVHIHIGGFDFNKENIILLYHTCYNLQKEVMEMLPSNRKNGEYCRYIKNLSINIDNIKPEFHNYKYYIDYYYNSIMMFCSGGNFCNEENNKSKQHPLGRKCQWNHGTARYCWVNFIPAIFKNHESHTLEFRMPSASLDYRKNKMWLMLCMGIIDFVENHKDSIYDKLPITLNNIVNVSYGSKGYDIVNFIEERKSKYSLTISVEERKKNELNDYNEMYLDDNLTIKSL